MSESIKLITITTPESPGLTPTKGLDLTVLLGGAKPEQNNPPYYLWKVEGSGGLSIEQTKVLPHCMEQKNGKHHYK